jgi:NDP-sugar pyrophosphorylase family protein
VGFGFPVAEIMSREYRFWPAAEPIEGALAYLKRIRCRHLPIVDEKRKLIDLILLDRLEFGTLENIVVLMVGGVGSRLEPLTKEVPKPMLQIGGKPLLEGVLETLVQHGFYRFCFCVNHLAHQIEDHFKDGTKWGVNIRYIRESKRLGTAGGLSLLEEKVEIPLIVMNGDLLTNIDFAALLNHHHEHRSRATMCVRRHKVEVPYGVIETEGVRITRILEKPSHHLLINAGVYVIEPECLDWIPRGEYFDMPDLFNRALVAGLMTSVFSTDEYWLDIGRMDDYKKAQRVFKVIGS